jgi:hypothetical protein
VNLLTLEDRSPADVTGREWIVRVRHARNVAATDYAAVFSASSWDEAITFWAMWPGTSS